MKINNKLEKVITVAGYLSGAYLIYTQRIEGDVYGVVMGIVLIAFMYLAHSSNAGWRRALDGWDVALKGWNESVELHSQLLDAIVEENKTNQKEN